MADVVQSFVDEPTQEGFNDMRKAELVEVARILEIPIKTSDRKAEIKDTISEFFFTNTGIWPASLPEDEAGTDDSEIITPLGTFKLSSSKKGGQGVPRRGALAPSIPKPDLDQKPNKACFYCKKDGHVMSACWKLKKKREKEGISNPKALPDAFAITRKEHLPSFERVAKNYKPFISSGPIPAFEEPFSRVIVDCVGPLPRTKSGNQYLLTMMCASTRFPKAIPLRTITAKNVSKALVKFFTMVGLPKCVQSDQGSNFTSKIFQQVMSELGVECKNSSALERFHQTLKNMMRVYCSEHEKEWDEGIPLLLFAVRESVQESLGFSPFELVFGHSVRGPLKILQEKILVEPESNLLDYVCQFKDRLSCTRELAAGHLKAAQSNMKRLFDRKMKERHFEPGSKVLVLLPLQGDALKAGYAGPYVVEKRDGSLRFCTDYRLLNSKTKSDLYPLPRIDDCIDRVGNAKYVSKFDLLKGYWQVPLSERAKELSAFVTPDGFFQYKVMPFGMKNAPATFQRLINTVTSGLVGCEAYLDDIIVYSHTWEDHLLRVRALFDRLTSANLTVNLRKCEFSRAKVVFLGHIVGHGSVKPVEAKVETILNFPRPQSKRELRRFLGMTGYYRKFCHNFADVATPLTNMLRKDSQFDWSDDCQVAFNRLKAMLASSPVLAAPNFDKQFILMIG
ncbi:uncharacterized protein [Diadema setosum]|uniref:uncharacterized protein n=1 Tax=Diadema setosum TaxID=31175 RepID=UPI003B3A712E